MQGWMNVRESSSRALEQGTRGGTAAAMRDESETLLWEKCRPPSACTVGSRSCSPSSAFVRARALCGFGHGKMEGVENSHSGTIAIPTHNGSWDFSKVMRLCRKH